MSNYSIQLNKVKNGLIEEGLMDKALASLAEIISDILKQTYRHPVVLAALTRPVMEVFIEHFQNMIDDARWEKMNITPL